MSPETTNHEKFQTGNPVVRKLIDDFFNKIRSRVAAAHANHLLDAGCGEGMTLQRLGDLVPEEVTGFDINPECVAYTKSLFPSAEITQEDIYNLPYPTSSFELIICLEVMEHLPDPEAALTSLHRVASDRLIFSVPHEPYFQIGSFLRGKYWRSLGNHPEHVNHWSPASFKALLSRHFKEVEVDTSFPWIIAEVRKH